MLPILLVLTACSPSQGLFLYNPSALQGGTDTAEADADTDADTDTDTDTDADTDTDTDTDVSPQAPRSGDLVISELMINPSGVSDEDGEWVELVNVSGVPLDLTGLTLSDEGADFYLLKLSGVVLPSGDRLVLCGNDSRADNGGVSCDSEYLYQSFGGGFALANGGDEVIISLDGGPLLDVVRYSDGAAPTGASLGLDPGCLSASGNDSPGCWCAQTGSLSSGDAGNPGAPNRGC